MFKFFQNKVYPIGIDLGRSSLKMIQLSGKDGAVSLVAAGKAEVPDEVRGNPGLLQRWYIQNIRRLLASHPFKGKKAITALPSGDILIQHLRLAKMDAKQLEQTLPFTAQEKLPFSTQGALLRHIIAGEIYEKDENMLEVILMAASREAVRQHLQLIEQTKLEIELVNVECCALVNSFSHLLSSSESNMSVMLIDTGYSCSKVVVSHEGQISFCRTIDSGAEMMVDELRSCVRYHDLLFTGWPVRKVIFVGGQARNKDLCQEIARGLGLAAQVGDPLAQIVDGASVLPSAIEADSVNPEWAVAFGLSLGGVN